MNRTLLLLVAIAALSSAAEPLNVVVLEDAPDLSSYSDSLVMVTADLTDARGDGVLGLETGNFTVIAGPDTSNLVDEAESFYESEYGIAVIMCLDVSGSMRGEPLEQMQNAVCSYLDSLRVQDRAAIVIFHDEVEKIADFSNDTDYLKNVVRSISTQGSITELFYAIHTSLGYFNTASGIPQRHIMVVISDGKDEGHAYTLDDCVERASQQGVPINTIGFALEQNRSFLRNLENLSTRTGGRYNYAEESDDLERQLLSTIDYMKSRYLVTFRVPDSLFMESHQPYQMVIETRNFSGSDEFILSIPASVLSSLETDEQEAVEDGASGGFNYIYLVVAGGVIVLVIVIILLSRKAMRKKEEEYRKRQEEYDESLREANRKAQEAERKAQEKSGQEEVKSQKPSAIPEDVLDASSSEESHLEQESHDDAPPAPLSRGGGGRSVHRRTVVGGTAPPSYETAELVVIDGSNAGTTFPLEQSEITIGRAGDNSIVFDDDTVSGHHAVVRNAAGVFQITDLDSTNGTHVNGELEKSKLLENGDVLKLGAVRIRFEAR